MSDVFLNNATCVQEPGFFGKIPARGDFVTRRLAPAVVKPLDDWLQLSIATSRRQLGDDWLPTYLGTPIWRFILGPGVCGETAMAGVLMPSVDRVGRYFPLVLAAALPGCVAPVRLIEDARSWFDMVEALALSSLDDIFDFEAFDEAAKALGMPPYETARDSRNGSGFRIELDGDGKLAETYGHILDQVLIGFHNRFSLWWTGGSDRVASSLLIAPGLPAPQNYAAFLDGLWERWGWERPADTTLKLDSTDLPILLLKPLIEMPSHGRTHPGTQRRLNQDAFLVRADLGLWAVADGLGGHDAGDVASEAVVEALNEVLPPLSSRGFVEDAREALRIANKALCAQAASYGEQALIASTAVVLLIYANRFTCLWIGDSRIYLLRGKTLRLLTSDHVAAGLTPQRRSSTVVTRAVGAVEQIEIDMVQDTLLPGDRFLLCSDGVTKVLSDGELASLLNGQAPPRETVDAIIENILVSGAPDNLTAVVVDVPAKERTP
ncbi:type VI secretion system-associated protein TagF [Telmatospirillum sp.]|uniref:type VI secretion system-associated protein TagF n=1 Tax=Telmatospirillum sp. TaxID=2079197 RepID=UPI00284BAE53|nr:type VI secretion system-associated protein TagF [Telmatospirillum sp.]MDR3435261.1 type VI secretion system-associated protein TagF [Telmatospirillum sp.]